VGHTFEKALSMPLFKLLDLLAQSRLGHIEPSGSLAEAQLLCDGDECDEVTKIGALNHGCTNLEMLNSAGRSMHGQLMRIS
jgi:hypothetical protein